MKLKECLLPVTSLTVFITAVSLQFTLAQSPEPAYVMTDQPGYQLGGVVLITGGGFQAGETVALQVLRTDGTNCPTPEHQAWAVVSDETGAISTRWFICPAESPGTMLQLLAGGQSSRQTASATFLNGAAITAYVNTDQADYAPGSTVFITGGGFDPGENVSVQVVHADGSGTNDPVHQPWTVVADTNGTFQTFWNVGNDHLGASLQVLAYRDASEPAAQTGFVDTGGPPPGYDLRFDGVNDYVRVSPGPNLANVSFSIEFWVRRGDAHSGDHWIVSQGPESPNVGLHIGFRNNRMCFNFWANDLQNANATTDMLWHHWGFTYDASTRARKIFCDGNLVAGDTASANYSGSGILYLGQRSSINYFKGSLDEVRIWNVARSQADIQSNMNAALAGTEPGLMGYWPFNEGSGTTTADATGHGYTGTLVNGPTWFINSVPVPRLVHRWTFNEGTANDSVGAAHGTLVNGATVSGGQLHLNGINQYMWTAPIRESISAKTLIAWVSLDNLDQQSGSALTIQNSTSTDIFDTIGFAEFQPQRWAAGSDYGNRVECYPSTTCQLAHPAEDTTSEVMIAIVYGDDQDPNNIKIYRNGTLYANYIPPRLNLGNSTELRQTYPAGVANVLIGLRHSDAAGQTGCATCRDAYLAGAVNEARIYNFALDAENIARIHQAGPDALPPLGKLCGCLGIRQANPDAPDGEYLITVNGQTFQAYCHDMANYPREYLTLVNIGGNYNFSQNTAGGARPGSNTRTWYHKVRIDPATLVVDTADQTFSASDVGTFTPMPYADAESCAWSPIGLANIDLRGTPFAVDDTFATYGYYPSGNATFSDNAQVVNLTGGGYCGWLTASPATRNNIGAPKLDLRLLYSLNAPPVAKCKSVTVSAGANCSADASINDSSYDLNGDPITLTQSPAGPYSLGDTLVTLTVTDTQGASDSCQATVTVVDNTPPVITCPATIVQSTDAGVCHATVAVTPAIAADNCGATVTGVRSDAQPLDAVYPKGVTTITWTATDAVNNPVSCTQSITVNDTENPTIAAPPAVVVNTDVGKCEASNVALGAPVTGDNCGVASVVNDAPAIFPKGATTVTWTVTDTSGNTATATQTVTVNDNEPPTITAPADVLVVSDPGSSSATGVVLGTPTIADNCAVTAAHNRPSTTYPLGETIVTWTATDSSGHTATCDQKVTVLASVSATYLSPLAGQPVANKIRHGQVVPHKVTLVNCSGAAVTAGVTVKLKVQGIDSVSGEVFQEVPEDANGVGSDGTVTSDGVMVLTDGKYQFNLDTSNFGDANTIASPTRYYRSTVTVVDNATLLELGTVAVNLETRR